MINVTVCLKYHKHKAKRNLNWNGRSWQGDWNVAEYFRIKYTVANSFT